MTGKILLRNDGIRKTIYKFSTYVGTDGQVQPMATFAITDGGVVSVVDTDALNEAFAKTPNHFHLERMPSESSEFLLRLQRYVADLGQLGRKETSVYTALWFRRKGVSHRLLGGL